MVNREHEDPRALHDEEDGEWEATQQRPSDLSMHCRIHQRTAREVFEQVVDRREKRIRLAKWCVVRVRVGDVSCR